MHKKIAVIDYFPGVPNAEKETILRISNAAKELGIKTIQVNSQGYYIDDSKKRISQDHTDFVIALHFCTPKQYDVFSYMALWNPVEFYFDWGYTQHSKNLLSHDDFLSCSSNAADNQISRMIQNNQYRLSPEFKLYHSIATPVIAPRIHDHPKIFYCGINWEGINKKTNSRHFNIIEHLAKIDLAYIYGPKKRWKGIKGYQKEIPFDGKSLVHEIASCGIVLAFSSKAHRASSLMSSRLFEGAAAGAVIICDQNEFAYKFFGNSLLYIDTTKSDNDVAEQIIQTYTWIIKNKSKALEKAKEAQNIFKKHFCLKKALSNIYTKHKERKKAAEDAYLSKIQKHKVTIVYFYWKHNLDTIDTLINNIQNQHYKNVNLVFLIDELLTSKEKKEIQTNFKNVDIDFQQLITPLFHREIVNQSITYRRAIGEILLEITKNLKPNNYIMLLNQGEEIFSDHISAMIRQIEDSEADVVGSNIASNDYILEPRKDHKNECLSFDNNLANIVFRNSLLNKSDHTLIKYLDSFLNGYLIFKSKNFISTKRTTSLYNNITFTPTRTSVSLETLFIKDIYPSAEIVLADTENRPEIKKTIEKFFKALNINPSIIKILKWIYTKLLTKN